MIYRFAGSELATARRVFRRDGEVIELEPQVFDLIALFARRAGEVIGHDELIEEVWRGRIVSDSAVASRIAAVRRATGDDGKRQGILRTVQRRGFRLVPEVTVTGEAPAAPAAAPAEVRQHVRMARSRDGASIAFTTTGSGPPLMRAGHFLTHLEADWRSPVWRPLLDRLGGRFSVTRYDQRGTGLSDALPPAPSLSAYVDDLQAVADAAGLDRFPIFAASQGVPIAIAFAARCPDRVTRLALYGGYARGRSVRGTPEDAERADAILRIIRDGWGRSGGAFAQAFTTLYMPDARPEELAAMVEMQLASATPGNAVALWRAIDAFDVSALLQSVRAPSLILHARDDAVHPASQARVLASGIPDAELMILDSRNHVPLPHDPAWQHLVSAATEFLSG